ncbi:hypothetical protein H9X57_04380 [Flavobacterium piscinae]|uniref:hypothetical protein n=1 Tax=Flavobacterium piscinae TaxID=2506424 RepID=UPI0019963EF5|nr:hypothetical protein [Flavobacterium piscinae]MBC8882885.1 hypothetical protein [Flavobacterium piscinae]
MGGFGGFVRDLFDRASVVVRKTPPFSEHGSNKSGINPEGNPFFGEEFVGRKGAEVLRFRGAEVLRY